VRVFRINIEILLLALVLAAVTVCASHPLKAQEEEPPKTVSIHVHFVTSQGNPVTTLKPEQIHVFDSGVEVPVVKVHEPGEVFDVGLLLDVSPSVHEMVDVIQDSTSRFFHTLREDAQGLLLTFDSELYLDCDWTTDRKALDEAIYEWGLHKPGNTTVIYDALVIALEKKYVERGPRQALILLSDGVEQGKHQVEKDESLEVAQQAGVLVFPLQYDSRAHYRKLYGSITDYDPRRDPRPAGSTGTDIGGIFVGSGSSERDITEYKVQRTFEKASNYMRAVERSGRGPYRLLLKSSDFYKTYEEILGHLTNLYTITVVPRNKKGFRSVAILTDRDDVTAIPLTKGYWAPTNKP